MLYTSQKIPEKRQWAQRKNLSDFFDNTIKRILPYNHHLIKHKWGDSHSHSHNSVYAAHTFRSQNEIQNFTIRIWSGTKCCQFTIKHKTVEFETGYFFRTMNAWEVSIVLIFASSQRELLIGSEILCNFSNRIHFPMSDECEHASVQSLGWMNNNVLQQK